MIIHHQNNVAAFAGGHITYYPFRVFSIQNSGQGDPPAGRATKNTAQWGRTPVGRRFQAVKCASFNNRMGQ